jgi:uncharacterized membrane protein YgcG
VLSTAGFALSWWVCQEPIGLDEGASLAIASALLTVVLAIAGWWAAQADGTGGTGGSGGTGGAGGTGGSGGGARRRLALKARAGRDVHMAGRDQTVISYRRRDE